MAGALIGALRVTLGLDIAEFAAGATKAQTSMRSLIQEMRGLGERWNEVGRDLTVGVTVPVAGIGAAVLRTAGDFEAAMQKVGISTGAAADQMEAMSSLAMKLGQDSVFGASDVAGAMDALAKNGLDATTILNGAAKAAIDLAAAAGSELGPATNAITDVMQQFKLTTADLPMAVNQITGAVNESKLDFTDFTGAIAQAGGAAAGLGVSFQDFNAVIAGTSALFDSGSDAGTSFKTFLTTLTPKSKEAAAAMEEYGLNFYDAAGKMKSMSDIAQMLQEKLGGLSNEKLNKVLPGIFGNDAMRTAIGLMRQGGKGLDAIIAKIRATDAAAQSAERMKGFNAQLEQLGGAFESLAIAIGNTGFLRAITKLVEHVANFVAWVATANPMLLKFVVGFAAVNAAIGPVMLVIGAMATTLLPLFLARLSPIGLAISALVNPIGTAVGVLTRLAIRFGAMQIAARLLPGLLGPVGIAITGIYIAYKNWDKIGPWIEAVVGKMKVASSDIGKHLKMIEAAVVPWFEGVVARTKQAAADFDKHLGVFERSVNEFDQRMGVPTKADFIKGLVPAFNEVNAKMAEFQKWLDETDRRLGLPTKTQFIESLGPRLRGEIDGINAKLAQLQKWCDDTDAAIARAFRSAVQSASALYAGVKTWLQDRLGAVMDWVSGKAKAVGDAFYTLYDRVVGHSYVPDMVDEIGAQMRRLDGEMVQPISKATQTAAEKFRQLQQELTPILERLFPEQAAHNAFLAELAALERGMSAAGYTAEQTAEAIRRLREEYRKKVTIETEAPNTQKPIEDEAQAIPAAVLDEWGKKVPQIEAANDRVIESYARMVDNVMGSLRGLADDIRSGDWLSALQSVLDIVTKLADAGIFGGTMQGNVRSGSSGLPGFATGGSFRVGGASGIDQNLIAFRATRGEMVDIRRPGQRAANDGAVVQLVVGEGQMFEPRVTGISGAVSVQTVSASQRRSTLRQRQYYGRS